MSNLKQPNGDDYPEAAAKNVDDAVVLLASLRYDGAGYLAGYAVECVLKTIIQLERGLTWGHRLNDLNQDALRAASLPASQTGKYVQQSPLTKISYGLPTGWQETLRYRAVGEIGENLAKEWVEEAQRLYREVIIPMRLDGVITS